MTRRPSRQFARYALLTLAGVLAIVGGRQFVTSGADLHGSTPAATLTAAALHGPQAVADRPSLPTAPVGFGLLVTPAVVLAVALLAGWAALELTDHRAWAIPTALRGRRRGPPLLFTV